MRKQHTPALVLTLAAACGSGPPGPSGQHAQASEPAHPAAVAPLDAAVPDAPPAAKLTCDAPSAPMAGPVPDPSLYCATPDGLRDGPFVTMFPDGTPEVLGMYKAGKLEGPWERHYPSGRIVEEGAYVAGKKDGHWKQLGPTGTVLGEYDMKAGTGTEKRWYDSGVPYSEHKRKNGTLDGPMKVFGTDGSVAISGKYAQGTLDGRHLVGNRLSMGIDETFSYGVRRGQHTIWRFGQLVVDENYNTHGKLDGPYVQWRDRKVMRVKGQYTNGKRDGAWLWWDRDNNKEREGTYVLGKKDGAWTEWYENKISYTGSFSSGKPDGTFSYFEKNGSPLGSYDIKDGNGIALTWWGNRKVSSKQRITNGVNDGAYLEYTPRGKLVVEGHIYGDFRHGAWKEQTDTGVPTLEAFYRRGRPDGKVKKYVDGKLSLEASYKDGKAEGTYTEFRDGKPAVTGQFAGDRKTGVWTQYAADGTTTLVTATYKDGVLDGAWRSSQNGELVEGTMTAGRRTGVWKHTDKAGQITKHDYAIR